MKLYQADIYFKDNPDITHSRIFCELENDLGEELEMAEQSVLDREIFYYLQYPDELEYLMNRDNWEDFVVVRRTPEQISVLTLLTDLQNGHQ